MENPQTFATAIGSCAKSCGSEKKNDIADVVGIVLLCVFNGGFTSHLRLRRFFLVVVVSFVFFSNTFLLCIFVPGGCLFIYFDGCHLVEAIFNRYG